VAAGHVDLFDDVFLLTMVEACHQFGDDFVTRTAGEQIPEDDLLACLSFIIRIDR